MRILRRILTVYLAVVLLAVATMTFGRSFLLPVTDCTFSQDAIDALQLETSYDSVRAALGCEGVRVSREPWGTEIVKEVYQWRGTAWPFGRLEAVFYNRVLHRTQKLWLNLDLALPAALSPATSALH